MPVYLSMQRVQHCPELEEPALVSPMALHREARIYNALSTYTPIISFDRRVCEKKRFVCAIYCEAAVGSMANNAVSHGRAPPRRVRITLLASIDRGAKKGARRSGNPPLGYSLAVRPGACLISRLGWHGRRDPARETSVPNDTGARVSANGVVASKSLRRKPSAAVLKT